MFGQHGPNWTEWELVRRATPRFPGHLQPKVPLWGEIDTGLPETWSFLNAQALSHGIGVYLWDFYWWADAPKNPLLVNGLHAFLRANNTRAVKWALMWANQDWADLMPARRGEGAGRAAPMFHGAMNATVFATMTQFWIDNYLTLPNYYRVPDPANASRACPLINVYMAANLVAGLGGAGAASAAMASFRARAAAAGVPCLHIQAEGFNIRGADGPAAIAALGVGSVTDYCWQHYQGMGEFPITPYADFAAAAIARIDSLSKETAPLPYIPNFSVAWDPSPRTIQSDAYDNWGYPSTPVVQPTVPELASALATLAQKISGECDPAARWCMMTVYAYTEFSEGGSLWPTVADGTGRLDAFKSVFGARPGW